MQYWMLWQQNASNCSKYDCVLKFTILAKSVVKDKYIRSVSFILDMGQKSVKTIGNPAPRNFGYGGAWK